MKTTAFIAGVVTTLSVALTSSAVTVGQIDTFEDGTTQNWVAGLLGAPHPAPPANQSSGGPAGVDDNFLLVSALGGAGPGSRLSAINFANQWAGDYIASGVSVITMDVRNFGTSDLFLRLSLSDPGFGPPVNVAFSSQPILLPAGGGWTSVTIPIGVADLSSGLGDVETALKGATELRLYHSQSAGVPNPGFPIPAIVARLGVDNIAARGSSGTPPPGTAVPEASSTGVLLTLAISALGILRRRPA